MLNNLIASHGFPKAVQYSGYLLLGVLILACALVHPRFVPASLRTGPMKKPSPAALFKSKPYSLLVAGLFFVAWGLFFPIFYIRKSVHSFYHLADDQRYTPKTKGFHQISHSTSSQY